MNPIFLIVGAPAVGKSTVAKALAALFPKSILIHVDEIRNMVVSGQVLPGEIWTDELVEQLKLARESTCHMACSYHNAGYVVIIDDFLDPYTHMSEYGSLLTQPEVHKILLAPDQQAAHERNLKRSGSGELRDFLDLGIRIVYQSLENSSNDLQSQGWHILNTTNLSVDETAASITALTIRDRVA